MGIRVVIAGGGTGGHLYPGIAVARELLSRQPAAQISFAGTAKGIEARVVPREGFALDLIRSGGIKGKSLVDRARGASLLPLGLVDASRIVTARRPVRTARAIDSSAPARRSAPTASWAPHAWRP